MTGVERVDKRPLAYRYNVGVQRELGRKVVLDVAYIGDQTRYLPVTRNYNAVPAGARFLPDNRDTTVTPSASNPGALPDVFLRPIIGFGDISITAPTGSSNYNSLQTQLTRRFTGGIELAGSSTLRVATRTSSRRTAPITTTPSARRPSGQPLSGGRLQPQQHPGASSSPLTIDIPKGSGKFGDATARSGCWTTGYRRINATTSSIGSVTFDDRQLSFTGGGGGAATRIVVSVQAGDASLPREPHDRQMVRHQLVWRPTGQRDVGNNCDNAKVVLPGFHNHDLSIFKTFPMKGSQRMQFRWEIYNLFNSLSFNEVDTSAIFDAAGNQTDTNFGKVISARNERRMQFSLRYSF